ncbi:unnamed protein product, partial [Nesidiocoris tenuis]
RTVARQALPPTSMLMHTVHRRPSFCILGHRTKYVGSSTAPGKHEGKQADEKGKPLKIRLRSASCNSESKHESATYAPARSWKRE